MVEVWHRIDGDRFWESHGQGFPEQFAKVADVETETLGEAYEKTNHISQSWTLNEGVKPLVTHPRSTSVGDVMVQNGKVFEVAGVGFTEIGGVTTA